jgi:hypothetical protein
MNHIADIDNDMIDLVNGGASLAASITVAADGTLTNSYTLGSKSGSFSVQIPAELVQRTGTFSFAA